MKDNKFENMALQIKVAPSPKVGAESPSSGGHISGSARGRKAGKKTVLEQRLHPAPIINERPFPFLIKESTTELSRFASGAQILETEYTPSLPKEASAVQLQESGAKEDKRGSGEKIDLVSHQADKRQVIRGPSLVAKNRSRLHLSSQSKDLEALGANLSTFGLLPK